MLSPLPVNVEIRHFHMFCGLGGGALGFQRGHARVGSLVAEMRCVGGIDSDPRAIVDFNRSVGVRATYMDLFDREQFEAWHGKAPPPQWREVGPDDIRNAVIGGGTPDIVFLSPPCLPSDGLIVTPSGPVEIQNLRAGDLVLTHLGRYRPVSKIGTHLYDGEMCGFRLGGTVDVQRFTVEHPMYVRRTTRPNQKNGGPRKLGEPRFVPAGEIRVGDRIGYPVNQEVDGTAVQFVGKFGDPQDVQRTSKFGLEFDTSDSKIVDLRSHAKDRSLWFILGFYTGDGYRVTSKNEICFCVGAENGPKAELVRTDLTSLGLKWSTDRSGGSTNVKLRVSSKHLCQLCGEFGDGAENKHVPPELFGLESELIDSLLSGWRAADGSSAERRERPPEQKGSKFHQAYWKIVSVSLQALRDIQRLLLRDHVFGGIHVAWPGGPQEIMGRIVQTLPRWELKVSLEPKKRTIYEFIDGHVWVRVRQIVKKDVVQESVWNLEVDEDNTFCSPMMATHNCKGASGLQNPKRGASPKYQALNRLTLRGISLMLQAFEDDPVPLVILENVPRIQTAGKELLDQIDLLLECAGYAVTHTVHDAGVLGGLAQHRKRFLLVARHKAKVPAFLYEAPQRRVRTVGEVIGPMPLPDCGPRIHRMPRIEWQTWMRLALVTAGKDWRSLQDLDIGADGMVRGLRLMKESAVGSEQSTVEDPRTPNWTSERTGRVSAYRQYGVQPWDETSHTVTGQAAPGAGPFSVADPRTGNAFPTTYGVRAWDDASSTVTGAAYPTTGTFSVADPRLDGWGGRGKGRVAPWDGEAGTVIGASTTGSGAFVIQDPRLTRDRFGNAVRVSSWEETSGTITSTKGGDQSVADPRQLVTGRFNDVYRVVPWDEAAGCVTAATGNSRPNIADPRPKTWKEGRKSWEGGGHYGVVPWEESSPTVTGHGQHDNGYVSVADPRVATHRPAHDPGHKPKKTPLIIALDGTWHRPFTTLELAALQGFDWQFLLGHGLYGDNESDWRERIGNAVPPPAAEAIASTMAETLLMAMAGVSVPIGNTPIWVRGITTALSMWQ